MDQKERDKLLADFDGYMKSRATSSGSLRERNAKVIAKHALENAEVKAMRESVKRRYGIDPMTDVDKFPVMKEGFSWKRFRGQLEEQLREADSETAFTQFLVAGLLQNVIGMYTLANTSYQDWVTVTPTNLKETPVAPLHGLSFPREVGEQMPYPVSKTAALSLKFTARKYGTMYEVTKELLEDDQSGAFKQQTGMLGEYLALLTEVLVYGRLGSVTGSQYAGFVPGNTETQPTNEANYPWTSSAAPFVGGGFNRPVAFGVFNDANLKTAIKTLGQQKNLLGIVLPVNPNRIIVSPFYQFDVATILNSAYYPAGAQAAGVTGGAFSINPLKGIADASISKFLGSSDGSFANSSTAWYVVDDSKPWFQVVTRTPVAVEQENPLSGQSFERDIYRFKANTRITADFVDPRFAWQGSDGSV